MNELSEWAGLIWTISTTLALVTGVIFWVISSKLKEEFVTKKDCDKKHSHIDSNCEHKHSRLDADFNIYRSNISNDINEIKEMVREIRGWVFNAINKTK
jgi:ABC-type nickel/cobalt efflux system permease component RcnA